MASWPEKRAEFVQKFTAIGNYIQNQLQTDIQNLSTSMANYVQAGGVSIDPSQDPNTIGILKASMSIRANQGNMLALNRELSNTIRNYASENDMNGLLAENGRIQQAIQNTQQTKQDTESDAKAAELRDELLRTRAHNVNTHQLFLLGRPLRPGSIPYLWALSALFVGIGLLMAGMSFPSLNIANQLQGQGFMDVLGEPAVWGSLLGAAAIVILFLSLDVAGVFKAT